MYWSQVRILAGPPDNSMISINKVTFCFIIIISIFAIYCSTIIGISWDEPSSNAYSLAKINFLKSFGESTDHLKYFESQNPGFYTTILAFISNLFPTSFVYEIRHLINLSLSFLTLFGLYLLVKENFDKRIALFTVLFCLLNPFFFGLMSITVRDIPVCFAYVWTTYFFFKYIDNFFKERIKYIIFLGIIIGFGFGSRLVFVVNLIPLFLILIFFLILNKNRIRPIPEFFKILKEFLIVLVLSLLVVFSFWVSAYENPIRMLITTLLGSLNLSGPTIGGAQIGPTADIIGGQIYNTANTPPTYLFTYFFTRFPIFLIFLFIIFFPILIIKNNYFAQEYKHYNYKVLSNFIILFFPIILIVSLNIKIYDGIRLIIFLIPFFSFFSAISFNYLLKNIKNNKINIIALLLIFFSFSLFLERFIRLTPYQYDFANYTYASFKDSKNAYHHDYWAISYNELIKKIKHDKEFRNKKFSISVCGGDIWQVVNELRKDADFKKNVSYYHPLFSHKADYIIMINRLGFHKKYLTEKCFDRFEGNDIYSVERLGITYSVIRKQKL